MGGLRWSTPYLDFSPRLFFFMSDGHIPLRIHSISQLEAYMVTADELDSLEREGCDVGLNFHTCLFCLTLAISFAVTLVTTTIDSRKTFDIFVIIVVVGTILGIYFGIEWYRNRGAFGAIFERIKERQVGPTGSTDHRLPASQIAQLPGVAAPTGMTVEVQEVHPEAGAQQPVAAPESR